jgi:hypothetical protein
MVMPPVFDNEPTINFASVRALQLCFAGGRGTDDDA